MLNHRLSTVNVIQVVNMCVRVCVCVIYINLGLIVEKYTNHQYTKDSHI